jgi:hypothetical protein
MLNWLQSRTCLPFLFPAALIILLAEPSLAALPDLRVNRAMLARTVEFTERTFESSDCELDEGCARSSGERRLMLFNVGIANVGRGDMVVGDPSNKTNWFHFSTCHGHYHMTGFAVYRLKRLNGTVLVTSRKQGFCFRDDRAFQGSTRPAQPYTCDYQGISRGWQDIYDQSVECQWLDITGVPAGNYNLEVTLNPKRWVRESNYGNNTVTIPVRVPRRR